MNKFIPKRSDSNNWLSRFFGLWRDYKIMEKILLIPFVMLLFVLTTSVSIAHAEFIKDGDEKTFTGMIGDDLKIEMKLSREGNKLSGSYFYFKYGKRPIGISGVIGKESGFTINEKFKGKVTGIFKGKVLSDGKAEGEWSSPDGKKVLAFKFVDAELEIQENIDKLESTNECTECDLTKANLRGIIDLNHANLHGANLSGADLSKANLFRVDLTGVDLTVANLTGAKLDGAVLCHTRMPNGRRVYSECTKADLRKVDLRKVDLSNVNLTGVNLSGADLSKASLSGANLEKADLKKAELSQANLTGANLNNADMKRANLFQTDLSKANLTNTKLDGAILCHTTMPDGKEDNSGCEKN